MSRTIRGVIRAYRPPVLGVSLAIVLAASLPASVVGAGAPPEPAPEARPEEPGSERASLRAEHAVARMLARLDEELGLGTFPDGSPYWPARLAASIKSRADDAPAQYLLERLAVELRALRADWSLGGRPDERPDGRPAAASPAGRVRAERIRRMRELVELVNRKLDLSEGDSEAGEAERLGRIEAGTEEPRPHRGRLVTKYGSDSCAAAVSLALGSTSGYTWSSTNDGHASCAGPTPSPDRWYLFTPSQDGTYTFELTAYDYHYGAFDPVLSLHSACPEAGDNHELACSDDAGGTLFSSISHPLTAGQPVWVRVSGYDGDTGEYLLGVQLDRTIRGTVTREDTGAPVEGAIVEILDDWGYVVSEATSGVDGAYAAGVGASPELHARARDEAFVTELYDDHECPFPGSCSTWQGDDISTASSDASGVDFTLEPGGSISGSVTAADTGLPPTDYSYVHVYDSAGSFLGTGSVHRQSGTFTIGSLSAGSYYLKVSAYDYREEVWPDVECPFPCDPTSGDPVVVGAGDQVAGIDFVVDRLGGIQGVVTVEGSGAPAASQSVQIYRADGGFAGSGYTRSDGSYGVSWLEAGAYFVRTATPTFFDELYDDLPCEPTCDVTSGTPVEVELNVSASGIDFALAPKASIAGSVTDGETGAPVSIRVFLYDAAGDALGYSFTSSGAYEFRGLEAGRYFARAGYASWDSHASHQGELYDGIPCDPDCDPTTGTPVVAGEGSQVTGIDFQLDRRGSIRGKVTDTGGNPLYDVPVTAYHLDGSAAASRYTGSDGTYEISFLPAGSYRVGTDSFLYRDEMYDGVVCGVPCDRTAGSQVTVQAKLETSGVDFALTRLGSISGTVRSASSGSGIEATVSLLDQTGAVVRSSYGYSSSYGLAGIQPGTYYLRAHHTDSYGGTPHQDEIYPDVPCEPDCDLARGTPVVVGLGTALTGLDFVLAPCPVETRRELVSTTIATSFKALACDQVTASAVTLAPGADLLLRSGRSVVLGDGFKTGDGAHLQVVIEPTWSDE